MVSNPLHEVGGSAIAWSTVNAGENFPGVATPLGWTFWRDPLERAMRGAFADFGVLTEADVRVAESVDDRFTSLVFGRFAGNVDQLRMVSDLMPGASGEETELQIFGSVRPGVPSNPSRRRYPVVAAKMPVCAATLSRRVHRLRAEVEPWWRLRTAPGAVADAALARTVLGEAATRFEQVMRAHVAATMLATATYGQVTSLARASGNPGLETVLASGYGGMEETRAIADLWRVSRGELTVEAFLDLHGYHAPTEAELASVAWREDPTPVRARADSYRRKADSSAPLLMESRQRAARLDAEGRVAAGLPRHRRPFARLVLGLAGRFIPLREVGKAAFLQSIDVGRASARALGRSLHEQGLLDDPGDVYFLTIDELLGDLPDDLSATVEQRRAVYDEYSAMEIPDRWIGLPERVAVAAATQTVEAATELIGIAVSPGVVEGVARVMTGPDSGELDDGEILVCSTTDPSWASLFLVAGALVIDIGGPMSHGAIVAREMGVPCVINTRWGTKAIRTGDRLRVDGTAGIVSILDSARSVTR